MQVHTRIVSAALLLARHASIFAVSVCRLTLDSATRDLFVNLVLQEIYMLIL
jgi:hypothetical protein